VRFFAALFVMAGLVPAIHVFRAAPKAWMPGTRPGMTAVNSTDAFVGLFETP
jgi:hypothetical protein